MRSSPRRAAITDSHDEHGAARGDRGDRRAGDAESWKRSEPENQHRIEHERDRDRREQQHERRARVAGRAERGVDREEAVDQRRSRTDTFRDSSRRAP